jgi:hypothetical protein
VAHLTGLSDDEAFIKLEETDAGTAQLEELLGAKADEKEFQKAVQTKILAFFARKGIRHVRLIEKIAMKPIQDRNGYIYKGFKPDGNAYLDIFQSQDGPQWEGSLVTIFDANAKQEESRTDPRRKIIRLFNRDMLELEHQGKRSFFYIQKMTRL